LTLRIPDTLEEATSTAWLSKSLSDPVVSATPDEVDNRVSTNQPVHVEFADGTSRDVWIKGILQRNRAAVPRR
jgi:hypothetical protein